MYSPVEACTKLIMDYVWFLDHPGSDVDKTAASFASLFCDDGVLLLPTLKLEDEIHTGPDQIGKRYLQYRTTTRFLHLMSNIRIDLMSDTEAKATSYISFYIHPIGESMDAASAIQGVAEYRDEFRRVEAGWKIARRQGLTRLYSGNRVISDPSD